MTAVPRLGQLLPYPAAGPSLAPCHTDSMGLPLPNPTQHRMDPPRGCPSPAMLISLLTAKGRKGEPSGPRGHAACGCAPWGLAAPAPRLAAGERVQVRVSARAPPAASHPGPLRDWDRDGQAMLSAPVVARGYRELSITDGRGEAETAHVHQHPTLVPRHLPSKSFVHSWFCKKLPKKELFLPLLIYHLPLCRMPQVPRHLSPPWDPVNPRSNHLAINQPYR